MLHQHLYCVIMELQQLRVSDDKKCHYPLATQKRRTLFIATMLCGTSVPLTAAFIPSPILRARTNHVRRLYETYGRGADIWPPANEEPIRLETSFPNGVIPDKAVEVLSSVVQQLPPQQEQQPTSKRRRYVPRTIQRILKRAANSQEETASDAPTSIDKTPMILAGFLVLSGMIKPLDALLVSFFTGYFAILYMWARGTRSDGYTPVLPSLPPQGHVPQLVANPLTPGFTTYSLNYDYWLKAGAVIGLLAPVVMMLRYVFLKQMDCASSCARPIFLLCCQAITEAVSRRSLVSCKNGVLPNEQYL